MSIRRRVERLEDQAVKAGEEQGSSYQATMVLCKAVGRNSAREEGRELPPYCHEEIEVAIKEAL